MDNFQMSDFNLNFEFDFQHDFTDGENCVIDDILANPVESASLFKTEAFMESQTSSSSFFDYLCNDSGCTSDVAAFDPLANNQLNQSSNTSLNRMTHEIENFQAESDGIIAQNVNFDWTTFLDNSSSQENIISDVSPITPDYSVNQSEFIDSRNVICDNGFVYEELKTLDVPQMYTNLDQTFGLMDLKTIDKSLDYSALGNEHQSGQNERNFVNSNASLVKQKIFLMPLNLNQSGRESLLQVATKLKNRPFILNSMLNQCDEKVSQSKILLPSRPKQIKHKSKRYLTVNEQLEEINTKEIVLPMIKLNRQRKKRKEMPKIDMEKVPVAYAVQVVVTKIFDGSLNRKNNMKTSSQSTGKKTTKPKKLTTKTTTSKRRTNEDPSFEEPKSNRRTNKKIKAT